MRIAELSRASGVPVPTIKYYLREGLLPPGEFSSPNQARYDEGHNRRLKLIRALINIGRVPISALKDLLADLDAPHPNLHHAIGRALQPGLQRDRDDTELAEAKAELDRVIERRGWQADCDSAAYRQIAEVMVTMRKLGAGDLLDGLDRYAGAADQIAATDLSLVINRGEGDEIVFGAVIGTILGDSLLQGLRRLAQESISAQVFSPSSGEPAGRMADASEADAGPVIK